MNRFSLFRVLGKNPTGAHLEKLKQSPRYHSNGFENLSETPMMLQGNSPWRIFFKFLNKPTGNHPSGRIGAVKTDLKAPGGPRPEIIWFGHSSYLIRLEGLQVLVDPVFSGHASPVPFMVKSFTGSDLYGPADFFQIDWLILTHDHYDHMDYRTLTQMRPQIKNIACSLGLSSHLLHWGFEPACIFELDWWQSLSLEKEVQLTAAPARHFSGRGLARGKTLWSSFILKSPGYQLYLGGDSGYDSHFEQIGQRFGAFDLVILESGQYNQMWPFIHMMPEQTIQAARDLNARVLLPVHWGKFSLALHDWREPMERILKAAPNFEGIVTTPRIGEPVVLGEPYPQSNWWRD